jgi:hypothetical protein
MLRACLPPAEAQQHNEPQLYTGYSESKNAAEAAAHLREQIGHSNVSLAVAFVSNQYDRSRMARHLHREFSGTTLIGCTTAGEIGPHGYAANGVAGLSFGRNDVLCDVGLIEQVSKVSSENCLRFAYELRQKLLQKAPRFDPSACFALLLIDGLCGHEERVVRAVHDGLGGIALVGGSAGDGLEFRETGIFYEGRFRTDAALLLVAASPHPVTTFKTQHFVAGERRLVLTREYARVIGVDRSQLDARVFSEHPLVVKIGGADFVRSIQKANDDDTLTFFCAIDEGIVFNVAERVDLANNLEALFKEIEDRIGPPQVVLGCDCMLRRIEIEQDGTKEKISAILKKHNVIGFNSYGEQYRGMHVNQTFTGIAIGVDAKHAGWADLNRRY